MEGNSNRIRTDSWSSLASRKLYEGQWADEPDTRQRYERGEQCGGCSFYAKFNSDWGLCAHAGSRHHLETVFEHFTCPAHVPEGWGAHSFSVDAGSDDRIGSEAADPAGPY